MAFPNIHCFCQTCLPLGGDWDNLDPEPVEIEIDADGDGTYEGSMSVRSNVAVEDLGIRTDETPTRFELKQNYPNPFNPSTNIRFDVPEDAHVLLVVYDVTGREVTRLLDRTVEAGTHELRWDASNLPSGTYLYRLTAGAYAATKAMTLLR